MEDIERDEKGDIKFDFGKFDWNQYRNSISTYVFRYWDSTRQYYLPYFDLFNTHDDSLDKIKNDPTFHEEQLYRMPKNPPFDSYIHHHNWQLTLLIEYFKEVFENRAHVDGHIPTNKFYRIILPAILYNEIETLINDYELSSIKDLLLEVIATAQYIYTEDVAFWERPKMQKLINTAENEARKIITIIEKTDSDEKLNSKSKTKPSELLRINFVFNDSTIKIEHSWLAAQFIDCFKKYHNEMPFKNWRLQLEQYSRHFDSNKKDQEFKYKLAKSLYNLLTKTELFKLTPSKLYPNKLLLFIAKFIEFCLIPVGSFEESDEIKIKHIRNWLRRKEIQPAITYYEIPPNKEILLKYFRSDFVNSTGDIKRADAIRTGMFLCIRFDINKLLPDLIHISQALKEYGSLIGHQLIGENRPFKPSFEEFDSFSRFVNGIKSQTKLVALKYKLEGDEREYELNQRLPLYLIEEAMKDYSEDQRVEFDTDPVATKITKLEDGGVRIERENQFNKPNERFIVQFVKSFYDYLLAEAPPLENESFPSEKYYSIIALMLEMNWFFYRKHHEEYFIIAKVKQWHKMALAKKENIIH